MGFMQEEKNTTSGFVGPTRHLHHVAKGAHSTQAANDLSTQTQARQSFQAIM